MGPARFPGRDCIIPPSAEFSPFDDPRAIPIPAGRTSPRRPPPGDGVMTSAGCDTTLGIAPSALRLRMKPMRSSAPLLVALALAFLSEAQAQDVKRDIPYADPALERQVLDVYSPAGAKGRPVVFWIHGGGWQAGDKSSVQEKPRAFVDNGFVFVSTNYRLLPGVDMATIVRDIAKSIGWVHGHVAEYGGDPNRLFVMGHSAGAQLAALVCTDGRYLKAEGVPLSAVKGCV